MVSKSEVVSILISLPVWVLPAADVLAYPTFRHLLHCDHASYHCARHTYISVSSPREQSYQAPRRILVPHYAALGAPQRHLPIAALHGSHLHFRCTRLSHLCLTATLTVRSLKGRRHFMLVKSWRFLKIWKTA